MSGERPSLHSVSASHLDDARCAPRATRHDLQADFMS